MSDSDRKTRSAEWFGKLGKDTSARSGISRPFSAVLRTRRARRTCGLSDACRPSVPQPQSGRRPTTLHNSGHSRGRH